MRYPGGKTRAVDFVIKLIPENVGKICSPFFGGGSIEIACAAKGIRVLGYDVFEPLTEFWNCVQNEREALASEVEKYFPLKKEKFYELQASQTKFKTKLERAAVFYVLNRSSYSGSTLSGGMSPEHPRFTMSSIERLRDFYNPNFQVEQLDFKQSILKHPKTFLYLDPPYLIKSRLYGKKGSTHKNFDHAALAKLLSKRANWILSYNNCPEIREIYKDYRILFPKWKYGMSNNKNSKEALVLSKDLT